ncbi:hypothetical protein DFH11DRAFT_1649649, partial [Phellopilus nigrolimitatus]
MADSAQQLASLSRIGSNLQHSTFYTPTVSLLVLIWCLQLLEDTMVAAVAARLIFMVGVTLCYAVLCA